MVQEPYEGGSVNDHVSLPSRLAQGAWWLPVAWLVGQVLVVLLFGRAGFVQYGVDSATFLAAAERFPSDQGTLRGYTGYVAVLAVGELLGSAAWFLVIVQNVLLLVACACLVDIGGRLGNRMAGVLGALALLLNPLFAQWFRYVLTETLFVSGIIVLLWVMVRSTDGGKGWRWAVMATAVAVATVRPNGALLIASALSFLGWTIAKGRRRALGVTAVLGPWLLAGIAALTLSSAQQIHGSENSFATKTLAGEVFWNETDSALPMPEPNRPVLNNLDVVVYALDHPVDVARLYGTRLGYELLQIRPRYSGQLNLFAIVTTPLLWAAAAAGWFRVRRSQVVTAHTLIVVPQAFLICVTWATPEGRFGWWLLGPSIVLSGVGAVATLDAIRNRRTSRVTAPKP